MNQSGANASALVDLQCQKPNGDQIRSTNKEVKNRLWLTDCDTVQLTEGRAGFIANPEQRGAKIVALKVGVVQPIGDKASTGVIGKKFDGLISFLQRDQIATEYFGGKSLADAPVFPLMPYNAVTLSVPSIQIFAAQEAHYPKKKGADAVRQFSIDSVTIEDLNSGESKHYSKQGSVITIPTADLTSNTDYKWSISTPSGKVSGQFYTDMSEDEVYIKEDLTELDELIDKNKQTKLHQELLAIRLKQSGYDFQGDNLQLRLRRAHDTLR